MKQLADLTTRRGRAEFKRRAEARMRQHDALPPRLRLVSNERGLAYALRLKAQMDQETARREALSVRETVFEGMF